jgi:hypothetical protein
MTRSFTSRQETRPCTWTVITGQTAYLKPGSLPAGAAVVTQGAEELLGVQNGVGEET